MCKSTEVWKGTVCSGASKLIHMVGAQYGVRSGEWKTIGLER